MESERRLLMTTGRHSITDIIDGLRLKTFSVREIVRSYLDAAKKHDAELGAFLRLRPEAEDEAKAADERLASGQPLRPLEGVPIALKDNLSLKGEVTTAGSKILEQYRGVLTATAVQRLQKAGAIVIGKTNLDEFAMGASTENSAYQPTKNPWDLTRVPGGSSGGSAVAVAAGMSVISLGSDTGGSIRQPASFCNVVGLKPTYGRVSRYGLFALSSSLDQIGPFAGRVQDAALVYQTMAGRDDCDQTSSDVSVGNVMSHLSTPLKGLRIGLPTEFLGEGVDPQVRDVVRAAAKQFEDLGATVSDVSIPHAPQGLATYYVIQPAEASSNLARYDGIRYGLSVRDGGGLGDIYRRSREHGFGAEVKRRILVGTFALSSGYADAYYGQAVRVRSLLREEFHTVFKDVDVLLTPTSPTLPFALGAKTQDPLTMYLADLLTVPANLANIPAMSLPGGFVNNLPVGIQLMAREWDEETMLRAGHAYQLATDWHARRPGQVAE